MADWLIVNSGGQNSVANVVYSNPGRVRSMLLPLEAVDDPEHRGEGKPDSDHVLHGRETGADEVGAHPVVRADEPVAALEAVRAEESVEASSEESEEEDQPAGTVEADEFHRSRPGRRLIFRPVGHLARVLLGRRL